MVYAPGHFRQAAERFTRRRYRTRRERLSVRAAAVVALVLLGLVVFSLTSHQRKTGNGCVDFNYTTMIGGAEMYKCGARARTLCAASASGGAVGEAAVGGTAVGGTAVGGKDIGEKSAGGKSVDTDFTIALRAACRKAKLPIGRS